MSAREPKSKAARSASRRGPSAGAASSARSLRQVPLAAMKDDFSRFLRLAARERLVITRHGQPAGVLIGFASPEDWFDYRLAHDPAFQRRVARASAALGRTGRIAGRLLPALALALAALCGPLSAQGRPAAVPAVAAPVTTVIVVRHAERAGDAASDPVLSPAGEVRAQALSQALAATHLTGIITTQLRRTGLTAAPAAEAAGLTPLVVSTAGGTPAHVQAVADTVRSRFAGGTVLVVGHSNTVAGIVTALGGPRLPDLCDTEFATLFVVVLRPGAEPSVVRARYGPEDPPPGAACR